MNIRDEILQYCEKEYVPKPFDFCNSIIQHQIIDILYKCSFLEAWDFVSRNLYNIYGILSDIRLITEKELLLIKNTCIDNLYAIEKLEYNKDLPKNYISTIIKLYFNKVEYMRIPKIANSIDDSFFGKKGIKISHLDAFTSDPFVYKFYLVQLYNKGSWDIMFESNTFKLEQLTDFLYQLNNQMIKNNLDHETLYVVGGYVCLINKDKYKSSDIDFFSKHDIQDVRYLAYEIGVQNNAMGWLSDMWSLAHNGYTTSLDEYLSIDDSFYEYLNLSKLTIMVQTDKCNLFTKLNSSRKKDLDDIPNILSRLSLTTKNQVLEFIKDYLSLKSAKIDTINNTLDSLLKN